MSAELLVELHAMNKPELCRVEGGMVYEIWQDGEITITKCGSLYRQRSCHMIVPGLNASVKLPNTSGTVNSYMPVEHKDLKRAREIIMAIAGIEDNFQRLIPG